MLRTRYTLTMIALLLVSAGTVLAVQPPKYRATLVGNPADYEAYMIDANLHGWSTGYVFGGSMGPWYHAYVADPEGNVTWLEFPEEQEELWGMPEAINDMGVVTGWMTTGTSFSGPRRLFQYTQESGLHEIGVPGGNYGTIEDLNNRGDITVAWQESSEGDMQSFLHSVDKGWQMLTPGSAVPDYSVAMNEAGAVAGVTYPGGAVTEGWIWRNGVLTSLGSLGGTSTLPYDINNSGVVVGQSSDAEGNRIAFRWTQQSGIQPLPLFPDAARSEATRVTDEGVIDGAQYVDWHRFAFVYSDESGLIDLRAAGEILGDGPTTIPGQNLTVIDTIDPLVYKIEPVLFSSEFGLVELNSLIEGESPLIIQQTVHVNECGEIFAFSPGSEEEPFAHRAAVILKPILPGDLNGDSSVDLKDFARMQRSFGKAGGATAAEGDLDGDGDVDTRDASGLLNIMKNPCR